MSATTTKGPWTAPRPLTTPPVRAMVVAIGNTLMGDDGLGPLFLQWFTQRYQAVPRVQLLDGGTGGAGLLEWLESGDDLVLVDALVPAEGEPGGTLRILDRDELSLGRRGLSSAAHELDLGNLLSSASWFGIDLRSVQLIGLTTGSTELGSGLTPPVEAALPSLAEALRHQLGHLGYRPPPRRAPWPKRPERRLSDP